jgi:hypothetical protein
MRVDDRHLTGNQAAQSGKTANPQEVERLNEPRQADSRPSGNADRVELSTLTGGLAHALEVLELRRTNQVELLAHEYGAGRYQVDAREVSRAMITEMRAAGAGDFGADSNSPEA